MSGFLDHIDVCNRHDLARYEPLRVGNALVGYLLPEAAAHLVERAGLFERAPDSAGVMLRPAAPAPLTATFAAAADRLGTAGLAGRRRGELYAVIERFGAAPLAAIDRGVATEFGIINLGCHLNGIVRRPNGLHMWVARRSRTKATFPGKLDNMVAGGQPLGIAPWDNLLKECEEEAGIPAEIASRSVATGTVSYMMDVPEGLRRHILFTYDLELPADFVPRPLDGEVEEFALLPVPEVARIVENEPEAFKYNCNLAIIDFLIRHGHIGPERPDYAALACGLRSPIR